MSLIFRKLIISNFKSFNDKVEFKLDRGAGLIYISGRNKLDPDLGANGVGKTTLWDALTWCLYGKTGRDYRPGSSIVPWGSKKEACVALQFAVKGQSYTLVRCRNPNSLTLIKDEVETTPANDDIDKLLGISEAMFRRTIVLAQFGTLFLDLKPDAQSQMFNEALNLDIWLDASDRATKAHKKHNASIQSVEIEMARDAGRLGVVKALIVDTKAARDAFEKEREKKREALQAQLKAMPKGDYASITKELVALKEDVDKTKRVYNTMLRQREALQPQLETISSDIKTYTKSLKGKKVCPECGQSVSTKHLKDKLETLEKALYDIEHEIGQTQQPLNLMEIALEKDQKKLARLWEEQGTAWKGEAVRVKLEALDKETNQHVKLLDAHRVQRETIKETLDLHQIALASFQLLAGAAEYWREAFKEIRLSLIDQVLEELSMATTAHAEALGLEGWSVEFATERETQAGNINVAFNVLLFPPDQNEAIKFESYSGGESQRWQLAVAFGLSEIVLARAGVQPNIEILDEPTRGLSSEGIEHLLEHLAERASELKRTIYVTEHHSLERGQFKAVVTVQKDEDGSTIIEGR